MNRQPLAGLLLPYIRRELPGWGAAFKWVGGLDDRDWADAPMRRVEGKLHHYQLRLNLANWSDRMSYFLGRYYDLETQLLIQALLRTGDTFVDVGANIGMIALLAARCVGSTGRVECFEPHPMAFKRLDEHLRENGLDHVSRHNLGLSDARDTLRLNMLTNHTGLSTFADVTGDDAALVTARYDVPVKRGDDVLHQLPTAPMTVKIDVEGFEVRVLRGLAHTLATHRPAVVTEVVDSHLARAGFSAADLSSFMTDLGYRLYDFGTRRVHLRHRLFVRPLASLEAKQGSNVLWLFPDGVHERRLPLDVVAGH